MKTHQGIDLWIVVGWILALVTIFPSALNAEVPQQFNYQGYLTDQSGDPVADDNYQMTFSIYNGTDALLWSETQSVAVNAGIYNVQIGQDPVGNPFPANLFERNRYLGVSVGSDPEMSPRQTLTSVPFAMRAEMAEGVVNGAVDTVHIVDSSVTEEKIANGAITTGKVATDAITSEKIVDGTVTAADIWDGSGSGLDADRLDGQDISHFATSAYVASLESRIAMLESTLANLTAVFQQQNTKRDGDTVVSKAVNIKVVNGTGGGTKTKNGTGNSIVGYNELRGSGDDRTGSHTMVVGKQHNYSSFGCLVVGQDSTISGEYASVSGGYE